MDSDTNYVIAHDRTILRPGHIVRCINKSGIDFLVEGQTYKVIDILPEYGRLVVEGCHSYFCSSRFVLESDSSSVGLKIDYDAHENLLRKLNEANSRIVEFERIKAEHLEFQKSMAEKLTKCEKFIRDNHRRLDDMDAAMSNDRPEIAHGIWKLMWQDSLNIVNDLGL